MAGGAANTPRHRQNAGLALQIHPHGCVCFGRHDLVSPQGAPDQGVPRHPSVWGRLRALNDRIENCWIGDLLACAALFVGLFSLIIFMGVLL